MMISFSRESVSSRRSREKFLEERRRLSRGASLGLCVSFLHPKRHEKKNRKVLNRYDQGILKKAQRIHLDLSGYFTLTFLSVAP